MRKNINKNCYNIDSTIDEKTAYIIEFLIDRGFYKNYSELVRKALIKYLKELGFRDI